MDRGDEVCRRREERCRVQDACGGMSGDEREIEAFVMLICFYAEA